MACIEILLEISLSLGYVVSTKKCLYCLKKHIFFVLKLNEVILSLPSKQFKIIKETRIEFKFSLDSL